MQSGVSGASAPAAAGYTLMEVLITLVIMALAASVVLPGLSSGLNSAARHAARLSFEERVLQLRRAAIDDGEAYMLGALPEGRRPDPQTHVATVDLPAGWSFKAEPAVVFFPDGTCSGGVVTLTGEGGRAQGTYVIRPPLCRPSKDAGK